MFGRLGNKATMPPSAHWRRPSTVFGLGVGGLGFRGLGFRVWGLGV